MDYAQLKPGRRFAPVRSALYFGQRLVTQPALRRLVVRMLTAALRRRHGSGRELHAGNGEDEAALAELSRSGYVPLGHLLGSEECVAIHAYLQDKPLTDRDRARKPFVLAQAPQGVRVADYHLRDVIACPHILALANSPPLLGLAARYLRCKPTISALGLRWSFPVAGSDSDLQAFHRDSEDWRYLKVLVYLTDVDLDAGPHVFLSGSHLTPAPARLRYYSDAAIAAMAAMAATAGNDGDGQLLTATGTRGFCFAVDTAGIHKGTAPRLLPRLMLQIQYSLLPGYAYRYAPETWDGPLLLDPYVNRLIVRRPR